MAKNTTRDPLVAKAVDVEPSWIRNSKPNSFGKVNLNPSEKANKYCTEMKNNRVYTNLGQAKLDKDTDKIRTLSDEEKAFRRGYVSAVNDNRMTYNKKNNPEKYKKDLKKQKAKKREYFSSRRKGGKK